MKSLVDKNGPQNFEVPDIPCSIIVEFSQREKDPILVRTINTYQGINTTWYRVLIPSANRLCPPILLVEPKTTVLQGSTRAIIPITIVGTAPIVCMYEI